MATYNIGPGQTYETFTALVAAVTLQPGDIVDGGDNTFVETWTIPQSGTSEQPITLRNANLYGAVPATYWSHPITGCYDAFPMGEAFGSTFWEKGTAVSVQSRVELDPIYGDADSDLITVAATGYSFVRKISSAYASTEVTIGLYVKQSSGRYIGIRCGGTSDAVFDFTTETFIVDGATTGRSVTKLTNGWYRLSVTNTPASGSFYYGFALTNASGSESASGGGSFYAFGFTLNSGAVSVNYSRINANLYAAHSSVAITHVLEDSEAMQKITWSSDIPTTEALMASGDFSYASNIVIVKPHDSTDLVSGLLELSIKAYGIDCNGKSYVDVYNVDVDKSYYIGILIHGASASVSIYNSDVSNIGNTGISVQDSATVLLDGVSITKSQEDGLDTFGTSVTTCIRCLSTYNGGVNGSVNKGDAYSSHDTATLNQSYCIAYGNSRSSRIDLSGSSGSLYNNSFYDDTALTVGSGGTYVIKNNILFGRSSSINIPATGVTSDYNVLYSDVATAYIYDGTLYTYTDYLTASSQDQHSKNVDPKFRSATDYHLLSSSPCINAGTFISDMTTDFDGNKLPPSGSGFVPDIGAYDSYVGSEGTILCSVYLPWASSVIPSGVNIVPWAVFNSTTSSRFAIRRNSSGTFFPVYLSDGVTGAQSPAMEINAGYYVLIAQFSAATSQMRVGLYNPATGALTWGSYATYRGFFPIYGTGDQQRLRYNYGGSKFPIHISSTAWYNQILSDKEILRIIPSLTKYDPIT